MKSLFGVALALLLFGCSHTYSVGLEEGEELSEAVAVREQRSDGEIWVRYLSVGTRPVWQLHVGVRSQ